MKILYHHRTLGDGAEGIHIREMVSAFRDRGHVVRVIGPAGETPPGTSGSSSRLGEWKRLTPRIVFELAELMYSFYCFVLTSVHILRMRPHFVYDRYITFNVGAVLAAKVFRIPCALEVNAPLALERRNEKDEGITFFRLASILERLAATWATKTIVVSSPLKDYLVSIGVPKKNCILMPNGVNPKTFAARQPAQLLKRELQVSDGQMIVGFTGVLRPWHGLDLLLEAFTRLKDDIPNLVLLVVGDGPYRSQLELLIQDYDLRGKVIITGRVPHDKVPEYVSLFDIAVSPRATFYACPMKVIEYMCLARPVVVPQTPNFLDVVDEGISGVTFLEGNAASLRDAILLLANSPTLRLQIGANAEREVHLRLNWDNNARLVCEIMSCANRS